MEVIAAELDSAATRMADAAQRLQDELSSVDLEIDQLLGSGWKGGAASAYATEWDRWHSGAGQVIRGLQAMSELLAQAGDAYTRTDEQSAEAVDSSMQPTGGPAAGSAPVGGPASASGSGPATAAQSAGGTPTEAGGQDAMAQMMNLGQPAAQVGGPAASGLAQAAGQLMAGLLQAATGVAQGVSAIAQQAGQGQAEDATPAADEDERDDDREGAPSDEPSPTAAPNTAPVDPPSAGRESSPRVERPYPGPSGGEQR